MHLALVVQSVKDAYFTLPLSSPSQFSNFIQFFNTSGGEHLNLDNPALTSTPVCDQKCLLNTPFQRETTPKHQKENVG